MHRNLITDIRGIRVGNAADAHLRSGVTAVICDMPAIAACDIRGGAPGTRETDALDASCLVEQIHAVTLSGGSVFGLEAAAGVTQWLHENDRGFQVLGATVPIVPAAILFDLANGGDKDWGTQPPYRALGHAAAASATHDFSLGNQGAGFGARAGDLKGGLGSASAALPGGGMVGALVAVNCVGQTTIGDSGVFWAFAFERDGEFGGHRLPGDFDFGASGGALPGMMAGSGLNSPGAHTSLAVVATDIALDTPEAKRVAIMAHDGLARAIVPVHTPFDGDIVFVLSTGAHKADAGATGDAAGGDRATLLAQIGGLAADCVARATARGVYCAENLGGHRCYRHKFHRRQTG